MGNGYNRQANPYGGANWDDVAQVKAGGGVINAPSTPVVKDPWYKEGLNAFAASTGGKLFDGVVNKFGQKYTGGRYGGEDSETFDKDPGFIYDARTKAYGDASSNLKTEYDTNEAAYNEALAEKIKYYRATYKIPEEVSDEDVAKRVFKGLEGINPTKKYYTDKNTGEKRLNSHFEPNIPYYQRQSDLLINQKKGLDKWHSDWKSQPNIGKKVVKNGPGPNFMYKDPKKGSALYSEIFDDDKWGFQIGF
jgi:hypothetical protein